MTAALLLLPLLFRAQPEEVDFGGTTAQRLRLLSHRNARVRARAAMLLASARPDEAVEGLLVALHDADPGVRLQAARSLAGMRDERALPFLARRAREEPSMRVLPALLHAVGECGGPYAGRLLREALEHPRQEVRAAAAAALGRIGDALARDPLLAALRYEPDDPGYVVRSAVLSAFVALGWREDCERAIAELEAQGALQHWRSRGAILHAIGAARIEARAPFVEEAFLKDPDPRVVAAAADALGRLRRLDAVASGLGHASPIVRRAALTALAGAGDARGLRGARSMVREDPNLDVRFEAALVLSHADDPEADLYLVDALLAENPLYWITALQELERRHGRTFGRSPDRWSDYLKSLPPRSR